MKRNYLNTTALVALAGFAMPTAFDPGKSGWKLDADGKLELSNGNPVWVKEDGSEQSVDGGTISNLNGEAKNNRVRAEKAEGELKKFDGIDPVQAKKDKDMLSKIDQKTLVEAGEIDKVREEVGKGYQTQITDRDATIATQGATINRMTLDGVFNNSEFISDKVGVPREMFQAQFGQNFKVEDGVAVPYDAAGNKIYSKTRMGEVANVDEALEIMVDSYAHKDSILKSDNQSGSGNNGGGGNRGGGRKVSRSEFDQMSPVQQSETAALAGKGELTIGD